MCSDKVFLFGAGRIGCEALNYIGESRVLAVADNDKNRIGQFIQGKEIISPEQLLSRITDEKVVISVDIKNAYKVAKQLEEMNIHNFVSFYEIKNNVSKSDALYALSKIEGIEEQLTWLKDHTDIKTILPATGYKRKRQELQIEYMRELLDTLSSLDLHFFPVGGTLIGNLRHGGRFIPWDDDVDLGLMREDFDKLVDYFKREYHVEEYDGSWREYNNDIHMSRMDSLVRKYPNTYICDVWVDQIQIMRGTCDWDRLSVDIFVFDYYRDGYTMSDHYEFLRKFSEKRKKIDNIKDIIALNREEIKNNDNISKGKSSNICMGIDGLQTEERLRYIREWLPADVLFPLKKCSFEGIELWTANDETAFADYLYPNWSSYPDDVGKNLHTGYMDKYFSHKYITAEFYLIDAFEIFHFLPLYYYFEQKNIYSKFIIEPPDINTAGKWFDYESAKKILEFNRVRYSEHCNPEADYAFTTQDAYLLKKYKHKKVNLDYAYGWYYNTFSICERTCKGFDYKMVYGQKTFERIKNFPADKIYKIGSPKDKWKYPCFYVSSTELEKKIQEQNIANKPVLVYFPTWGERTSVSIFHDELIKLKERFFIVSKSHHCTDRLNSEYARRKELSEISDIVCEGNSDFSSVVKVGDIALVDALSGAATEVPLLKPEIKLVLLESALPEMNKFEPEIDNFAFRAKKPGELTRMVYKVWAEDMFLESRLKMLNRIYNPFGEDEFERFVSTMEKQKL